MRRNHCLHLDAYFLAHQAPTDSSKATVTQMDLVKLKGGEKKTPQSNRHFYEKEKKRGMIGDSNKMRQSVMRAASMLCVQSETDKEQTKGKTKQGVVAYAFHLSTSLIYRVPG